MVTTPNHRFILCAAFLVLLVAPISRAQQPASPSVQPLRVAIAGLAHGHVDGFFKTYLQDPRIQVVGVAEADQQVAASYAARYGLPRNLMFSDLDAMLQATHPQAVLVYTTTFDHRRTVEICARHGVDVMMEKPLAVSLEDAKAIQRAAQDGKIQVIVNYETTWHRSNQAVFALAHQGALGDIRKIVIHDGHQGPVEIGVKPPFLTWLVDPKLNGAGALFDFGCYGADLMTWMMHGEAPLTVTAVLNTDKPQIYPHVDDDATVVLTYPRAQAVLQASWNWPFGRKDMEVYGATGYAITVGADKLRLRRPGESDERLISAPSLNSPEQDSLSYLAAVIRGQIHPRGDLSALDTNIVVMQILDAARESARTGKTVKLSRLGD